jgi:uncharacterized protein (TIGR03083 family)
MADTPTWAAIHEQRTALAHFLDGLSPAQWDTPSLCDGWRVREVVAHLISTAHITPMKFVSGFVGSGFRFEAFSAKGIARYAGQTPEQLVADVRATATLTGGPPGPALTPLGEIVLHGEDLSRPLGVRRTYPEATLIAVADFYKGTQVLIGAKKRVAGLRLEATDADWRTGEGPEVRGPATSLLLAMAGRRAGLDDLTGDGMDVLSSRL